MKKIFIAIIFLACFKENTYAQDLYFENVQIKLDSAYRYYLGIIQNNTVDSILLINYSEKYSFNLETINSLSERINELNKESHVNLDYFYYDLDHAPMRMAFILPSHSISFKYKIFLNDSLPKIELTYRLVPYSLAQKLCEDPQLKTKKMRRLLLNYSLRTRTL